jgi:multidrug efflux pump subunit AcrA (membrane-fusion protein)
VADFAEADAAKVAVGQPATATLAALPDTEVAGRVIAVSPTSSVVSNVVEYPVTIALENVPSDVKQGMTTEVAVIVQSADDVLLLPSAAITTTGTTSTVKLLSKGQQVTTPITVGLVGTTDTEVTSGLTEGQAVVEPTATVSAATSGATTGRGFGGFGGGFGGGAP